MKTLDRGGARPPGARADPGANSEPPAQAVYLVGAGPGPVDLLTVKALRLLQQADVVIHDHLVGAEVLAAVRPGAQLIFVGKRGGQFCRPQAEIEELLVTHGRSGKLVVRLKGGDPLIFGRGGEEAATLAAAGLACEIVPGVTAALAAGAAAGIPLTHRDHSSAVIFLTGHENPDKADSTVQWEEYGKLNATLCIYMGVKNLASILTRLQAGGMSANLPAALVQSAATDEQRTLVATVGTLAFLAAQQHFTSPALVIVGEVVVGAGPQPLPTGPIVHAGAGGARSPSALGIVRVRDPNAVGPSALGDRAPPASAQASRSAGAIALIDNGSLAPAAVLNLRRVAAELAALTGLPITPVSWKHSNRIPAAELDGIAADTLAPWLRRQRQLGVSEFEFIPFFISPQGAIGSALRADLDALTAEVGGAYSFFPGLTDAIPAIVADRIRASIAEHRLPAPPVIVVDHGGPSPGSAALRDRLAVEIGILLGSSVAAVTAASMESPEGDQFGFNRPLLREALGDLAASGATDVVIAPLFLSPGRHAGPEGDLAQIARGIPRLRSHFTALVGTHPLAIAALAATLDPLICGHRASVQT